MVHVRLDSSNIKYADFQVGYGLNEITYFKGLPPYQRGYGYQRGAGLGDVLRGVWRFLLPIVKSPIAKEIGKEALNRSANILTKVSEGENLKTAAYDEGTKAAESLLEKSLSGVKNRQKGSGLHIKRRKKIKNLIPSHKILIPSKPAKRKRSDAFGFY